jgi:hypothetical protein
MLIDVINKILVLLFVLGCLNAIRHIYYFIQAWVKSNNDTPTKYRMGNVSLLFLGLSLAYIISSLVTGITI